MQQLKLVFKRTINWNKYQSKVTLQAQNQDLYYLDPSFPGANRIFVLSFEDNTHWKRHTGYFLQKLEIKDCNVMIDAENIFDQQLKNDLRTYENIRNSIH